MKPELTEEQRQEGLAKIRVMGNAIKRMFHLLFSADVEFVICARFVGEEKHLLIFGNTPSDSEEEMKSVLNEAYHRFHDPELERHTTDAKDLH